MVFKNSKSVSNEQCSIMLMSNCFRIFKF